MSRHHPRARAGQDRANLYDEITDKVIAELEAGRVPWVQPWGTAAAKAALAMPKNAVTSRHYGGINILILWGSVIEHGFMGQSWLTFRQALTLGGHVRKGERGTVLSYAIIADYFPVEIAARANGALNLAHFGWAFVVQYGIGLIVGHWPTQGGHYPVVAYQTAFGLSILLQAIALIWFVVPWLRDLTKHLSSASEHPDAGPASQLELVLAPAEGSVPRVGLVRSGSRLLRIFHFALRGRVG
jgi:hypothetical protein